MLGRSLSRALWHCRVMLALVAAAGCGGGSSSGGSQTSTFERIQTEVFDVSCTSSSCHSSVGQAGDLVLEAGSSWTSLMNHAPSNHSASGHGLMRILPGDPNNSFLLMKLTDNLAAGEGAPMPYNTAPLDAATVEIIRDWIAAGAPDTGRVRGDDGRPLGGGGENPGEISLPPPVRGVQLSITSRPVPVGTEETVCHYLKLPSDVDFDVDRIQISVTGGSHHIHLYRPYDKTLDVPDGFEQCNMAVDFDKWALVVATQLRKTDWELPQGVAFHFRAGEQLLVQTHFVNVGALETIGEGKVLMNLNAADRGSVTDYAGALFGQDRDVDVPPLSNVTGSATCTFPNPITIFAQTGHYHFRGKRFSTYRWDDGVRGEEIYHHEGYADPKFEIYDPADAPFFDSGQGLEWECYWENPTINEYKFGPFTDINEHCNLFAFYYPTQSLNESTTCVQKDGVSVTSVREGN
jgi:hypothetical protein